MWEGRSLQTVFMDVDDSLEWDLIYAGTKHSITSKTRLIPPECHAPCLVMARHMNHHSPILIKMIQKQELREIGENQSTLEGFASVAAWKRHWCRKTGSGYYSPIEEVWSYEFSQWEGISHGDDWEDVNVSVMASTILDYLYPTDL